MPITERTLKQWRKEALANLAETSKHQKDTDDLEGKFTRFTIGHCERILKMTQELLDQHLLRK